MAFKIFNTLTRKVEPFKPLHSGRVGMYACGPTVYNFAHIGNLRSFIFADVLRRWLEYSSLEVKHVMNITDVDDKTIKRSQDEGIQLFELTRRYEKAFFDDFSALRIRQPTIVSRATEHIVEMIELVKSLMERGYAYATEDGIYFSIAKFSGYGKLANLSKQQAKELKPGQYSRIAADQYEKEEMRDFALWKFYKPEDGAVFWDAPFGRGRPGWHIECSAMSMKYLGSSFDVHTGGVDLIFPHHQNEIAQSEAATGKQFVKHWVHCEHLLVDGKKMSKSLGNTFTLRDVVEHGFSPLAFRYFILSGHYRTQLNFTWDALKASQETLERLNDFAAKVRWLIKQLTEQKVPLKARSPDPGLLISINDSRKAFIHHMDDDLDTPQALTAVHEVVGVANKAIDSGRADIESLGKLNELIVMFNKIFDVLGLEDTTLNESDAEMVAERERLRAARKYKEADVLREALHKRGIRLEDTPYGVRQRHEKGM